MKKITFALVAALILGALTLALPKLKSDAKANPVAKPASAQLGDSACKKVVFKFQNKGQIYGTFVIGQQQHP